VRAGPVVLLDGSDAQKIEKIISPLVSVGCSGECRKVQVLLYSVCLDVLLLLIFRLNYGVMGCPLDCSDAQEIEKIISPSVSVGCSGECHKVHVLL